MALKNDLRKDQRSIKGSAMNEPISMPSYRRSENSVIIPESKGMSFLKKGLFVAFVLAFVSTFYFKKGVDTVKDLTDKGRTVVVNKNLNGLFTNTPASKLIKDMGEMMEQMGYKGLTPEDLSDLRKSGLTATFTAKIRDLGYDPSLKELENLARQGVTAEFVSMMHSLGYTHLSIDDIIRLRLHNVTAYYTSNLHDLGYKGITPDDLIKLRDAKVSIAMVKKVNQTRAVKASVDELIRYGISNQ